MPHDTGAPARTLAAGALGLALALALGACSSGTKDAGGEPTPSPTTAAASPSPSATPSKRPSAPASASASPVKKYVDTIPADLRASLFTQGSVPPSYADWISTSPQQSTVDGRHEVVVDRRLPPCEKDPAAHYDSDRHTAGFAATLFQAGTYIVARQLTVYHDVDEAKAAMQEMVDKNTSCTVYDGKQVSASVTGDLVDAAELDVPQHDKTVAGETSLTVGDATGVSWWTVISRQGTAVVLTRVADPSAKVRPSGGTDDSIKFRQAVLSQANTSAKALDGFAG